MAFNVIQGRRFKQISKLRIELQRLCANYSCNYFGTNSTHSLRQQYSNITD